MCACVCVCLCVCVCVWACVGVHVCAQFCEAKVTAFFGWTQATHLLSPQDMDALDALRGGICVVHNVQLLVLHIAHHIVPCNWHSRVVQEHPARVQINPAFTRQ